MKKYVSPKVISLVFGVLVVCFAIGFYVFGWVEPSGDAPSGNVPVPLNTSSNPQVKVGGLILNTGGAEFGLAVDRGKVGIGTKVPKAELNVTGWKTNSVQGSCPEGNDWYDEDGDGLIGIGECKQPGLVVKGGSVGIGTANPGSALHIQGSSPSGVIGLRLYNTGGHSWVLGVGGGGGGPLPSPIPNSFTIYDVDRNAYTMVIDGNGNVGIGITSPQSKLQVNGTVRAKEFILEDGDFIFEKNGSPSWRLYEDGGQIYVEDLVAGKTYRFLVEEVTP